MFVAKPSLSSRASGSVLLVVDEDASTFAVVARAAREAGLTARAATSIETALALIRVHQPFIVVTAIDLNGAGAKGVSFGRMCHQRYGCGVVFIGHQLPAQQAGAIASMRAAAFLCKPL